MSNPRAAVIGYGFAGRSFHSYLVSICESLDLHGVCSRSAETREKIADERGCKAYSSVDEVLADSDVDVVVLATPNATHCELAVKCLEGGKHVVTDKVAALNVAELDRMIDAAERTGNHLMVFQNRRWDGDYLTVRKLMDEGKLGRVRRVEMAWSGFGMWGGWRGTRAAGGGKLYDLGAHLIDQLCLICPQAITSVTARLQYDSPDHDVESDAVVMVGFEDGATALLETSSIAAIPKPRFYVTGSGGTFRKFGLDPQEAAMIKGDIDSAVNAEDTFGTYCDGKKVETVPTVPGRWRNYYENVAAVLKGEAEPAVKLAEVRRAIGVFDAAFESAKTGRSVEVNIPAAS